LLGEDSDLTEVAEMPQGELRKGGLTMPVLRLLVGTLLLVFSSAVLIAAAQELAVEHFNVPIAIIAATIVAFGTSLPELVTALTAVRKNQGELAIGNVIGADILNILFVSGAAAAVTSKGLAVEPVMFRLQFPAMLIVLGLFRIGIFSAKSGKLSRPFGALLLLSYIAYLTIAALGT
jgi:cation:H+ antiporter